MPNILPREYPEEYIHGVVTFFGREFIVTPDVLIPRLETEMLVRRARQILQKKGGERRLIDIGTGSGIIGTSCADLVQRIVFIDISEAALMIAEKNYRRYYGEGNAVFLLSDLLDHIDIYDPLEDGIVLVANLPYIKKGDWEHMSEDTRFEPELALFGGENTGFEMYERLFLQIKNKGISGTLLIEFGFDQRELAEEVIRLYGWKYEFFADYAGIERFCEIEV